MIYVFFAHGFEEMEAVATVDILRRAELNVKTVGVGAKTITGAHGITVHCDMIDHMLGTRDMEMVVLPGGMPGSLNLEKSETVCKAVEHAMQNGLWVGAICAAPSVLGHLGLLEQGRKVTCFPGFEEQLGGAQCTGARVEQDGKLITGKGPGATIDFALKLVENLAGAERAEAIRASLQ